jgi:asparagine synthetase B (glutamine-hydrolysing)
MCGIGLLLKACDAMIESSDGDEYVEQLKDRMKQQLTYRGPDVQHEVTFKHNHPVDSTAELYIEGPVVSHIWMFGSVLHIQGVVPVAQPFVDEAGEISCTGPSLHTCLSHDCISPMLYVRRQRSSVEWRSVWF